MHLVEENKLKEIIVVGDRLLIKPKDLKGKTKTGLYLPPGIREKERVQYGYVVKSGPGYPIPNQTDVEEVWKEESKKPKYLPLQVKTGDLAVFLQNESYEVIYKGEKYFIVAQSSILMIERSDD